MVTASTLGRLFVYNAVSVTVWVTVAISAFVSLAFLAEGLTAYNSWVMYSSIQFFEALHMVSTKSEWESSYTSLLAALIFCFCFVLIIGIFLYVYLFLFLFHFCREDRVCLCNSGCPKTCCVHNPDWPGTHRDAHSFTSRKHMLPLDPAVAFLVLCYLSSRGDCISHVPKRWHSIYLWRNTIKRHRYVVCIVGYDGPSLLWPWGWKMRSSKSSSAT